MKVERVQPYNADKSVGETELHFGTQFTVVETSSTKSVLVADLPEEEAQAMIDAGRATLVADLPEEEAQATGKGKK